MTIKIVYGAQFHQRSATNRGRKLTKTLFMVTVVSLLLTFLLLTFFHHEKIFSSDKDDSSDGDDYLDSLFFFKYLLT